MPTPQARIGQVLKGRWRIERLLGVGGMAAVYEARHRNGSQVAIKVLHASSSAEQKQRFQREAYAANRVNHRGAVHVYDDDVTEDGSPFLVMELLRGTTVAQRAAAAGGRLSYADTVDIGEQLLDVLAAAHAEGVLHRDIKPENLFLLEDGRLKVLDFGIARLSDSVLDTERTEQGTLLGTPAFVAPEQAVGDPAYIDERTDIWAVGATLFTLLSGRHVHPARTGNEQVALAMTRPAPPLASVVPEAPVGLREVVDRALAFEPRERFQSALQMQQALRALGSSRDLTAPRATPEPPPYRVSANETLIARPSSQWPAVQGRKRVAVLVLLPFALATVWLALRAGRARDEAEGLRTGNSEGEAPSVVQVKIVSTEPGQSTAPSHVTITAQPAAQNVETDRAAPKPPHTSSAKRQSAPPEPSSSDIAPAAPPPDPFERRH